MEKAPLKGDFFFFGVACEARDEGEPAHVPLSCREDITSSARLYGRLISEMPTLLWESFCFFL